MPEGITNRKFIPVVLLFDVKTEKGPKTKLTVNQKIPEVNPGKDPEKRSKVVEKPHVRPAPIMSMLPHEAAMVPIVRSPSKSPLNTPSSSPPSPLLPVVVEPVAMGTVEEIKNALIESNRVAAMLIPQFYGKKVRNLRIIYES